VRFATQPPVNPTHVCALPEGHALSSDSTIHPLPSYLTDGARLWRRLDQLSAIGATAAGGVTRPALSENEIAARRLVLDWARAAGFTAVADAAGNLFFRLEGALPDATPVLTGSYLDSQPNGGRYSGSYGALAALEAMTAIATLGRAPQRSIVTALWMNGEGSRFCPGYMGSGAFAGTRPLDQSLATRDPDGVTVADALARHHAAMSDVPRIAVGFPCAAYLETHLEQGPMLDDSGRQIGVVTGLQGVRRFRIRVEGEAAHAGSMPRQRRRDALSAAVRIISALEDFYAAPDITFTVGQLSVAPNAPSVVPRETQFSIDIRHRDTAVLARLGDAIRLICESEKGPCDITMTEVASSPSLDLDPGLQRLADDCARRLGLTTLPLVSQGGHDAASLADHCPCGIIFIPCRGGVSHSAAESIDPGSAYNGAKVLADVLWTLSNRS
jgi:beta-ureidopropionase / N-carbamoyl-L-amino-acid hydrolase